jgi:hypothetical protein
MRMGEPVLVDASDLGRAQDDGHLSRQSVAENLKRLLAGLQRLRGDPSVPVSERESQLREGMALAVKLADLLREMTEKQADEPPAG